MPEFAFWLQKTKTRVVCKSSLITLLNKKSLKSISIFRKLSFFGSMTNCEIKPIILGLPYCRCPSKNSYKLVLQSIHHVFPVASENRSYCKTSLYNHTFHTKCCSNRALTDHGNMIRHSIHPRPFPVGRLYCTVRDRS